MADDDNTSASPNALPVGTRAEIVPSEPRPEFDTVGGRAFGARTKGGDGSSDLLGIVCDNGLIPRLEMIGSMRATDNASILRFIDSGVVDWQDGTRRYALIYMRPIAPRMKQSVDEVHTPINDDFLTTHFVTPMLGALSELSRAGVTHNAIRTTNIFWRFGSTTPPQIGECLSAAAGFGQPVLFESLERAMCTPMGRGPGRNADDSYAAGVTLALMILGSNPMQGMSDDAIIRAKMERGSFGALIGNRRISPNHIEILRGLLNDDAQQRWAGVDLEQWSSGRRSTPKNTDAGRRSTRAFEFQGQEHWQARPLAAAMSANIPEAISIIGNGSLDKWLRRALNDETRANNIVAAQTSLKQTGKTAHYDDQLVARACIALDPTGPIRYRGVAAMPMGLPAMLVDALLSGGQVQVLAEIITSQLVSLWIEMQHDTKTEAVPFGQQLERMKGFIEKPGFGNGVERIVYELNPVLPCLSPILRNQFVTAAKGILPALERIATSSGRPPEPMDRHIAAFIIVRDRRSESLFDAFSSPPNSPRRGLALLTVLNDLQYRHGPDAVPHLSMWLLPLLEPAVQRFLGKTLKEKLREKIRETAGRGNLNTLVSLLDDPQRVERDQQEFMAARILYLNILKEIANLEGKIANRDAVVQESGKPMAASISTFIAILMVCAAIMRVVWRMIS